MPLSSKHFAQTQRINYFPIFIFCTYGPNVSMVMFLESCFTFNDSEAFSYKHVTYIKSMHYSQKLISLCYEKLDWSMLWKLNSKAEICAAN